MLNSKDINRRDFLKSVTTTTAGMMLLNNTAFSSIYQQEKKPNILMILVDDLGYGDASSYGAGDLRTPHIDRLISEGMKFTNFYANCPVCSPTRAALLSGRYQDLVGVPGVIRDEKHNTWGYLSPQAKLLSDILKEAGYKTGIVGKWHLGLESPNIPNERGFDSFKGFLGDMMDDYFIHERHGFNFMRDNKKEINPEGHATDLFSEWACDYIDDQKSSQQPFFLYLAYNAPHFPVQPPKDWLEKYKNWEPSQDSTRAELCAFIEHLDNGIGQVLQKLDETGERDNTIVVFTSDNGGLLRDGAHNGPYRSGKGRLYEGGLRVPMGVRWPGKIEAGSQSDFTSLTMDLYPTLAQAAGVKVNHEIDGINFLPLLKGENQLQPERDLFFGRMAGSIGPYKAKNGKGVTIHAIRRGDWKLMEPFPGEKPELYNLRTDPMERNDLAKTNPVKFQELNKALKAQLDRYAKVPFKKP